MTQVSTQEQGANPSTSLRAGSGPPAYAEKKQNTRCFDSLRPLARLPLAQHDSRNAAELRRKRATQLTLTLLPREKDNREFRAFIPKS
jgi:hypothetical protein